MASEIESCLILEANTDVNDINILLKNERGHEFQYITNWTILKLFLGSVLPRYL